MVSSSLSRCSSTREEYRAAPDPGTSAGGAGRRLPARTGKAPVLMGRGRGLRDEREGRGEGSAPWRGVQQPALRGQRDRLGPVVGAELAEERGGVELYRPLANAQGARDLLPGQALGDQMQHFALAAGERARAAGSPHRGDEVAATRGSRADPPLATARIAWAM